MGFDRFEGGEPSGITSEIQVRSQVRSQVRKEDQYYWLRVVSENKNWIQKEW